METPLPLEDYARYGRQMILDGIGLPGQLKLRNSSVVIIGAGGLGCPALQYLAAAGIGSIGIVDHDRVEVSNLQRQVLHNEQTVGMYKAESAAKALRQLNSSIQINPMTVALTSLNAVSLLEPYDFILDCTDNAPTRYLLSDTAVALGKPLVSGAAQKYEGQLCIYNLAGGPCYRCLFPKPPAQEMTGTCEETGILGVVTGIIGNLQAMETIKLVTELHDNKPSLLLFSALGIPQFRTIKLRSRKPTCSACGLEGQKSGEIKDMDYVQFCGGPAPNWAQRGLEQGDSGYRIRAMELEAALASESPSQVIDVRPRTEYGICHLPSSINIPLNEFVANPATYIPLEPSTKTYIVCRLGNDSQIAANALRSVESSNTGSVQDLLGGLRAWSKDVDSKFPIY